MWLGSATEISARMPWEVTENVAEYCCHEFDNNVGLTAFLLVEAMLKTDFPTEVFLRGISMQTAQQPRKAALDLGTV